MTEAKDHNLTQVQIRHPKPTGRNPTAYSGFLVLRSTGRSMRPEVSHPVSRGFCATQAARTFLFTSFCTVFTVFTVACRVCAGAGMRRLDASRDVLTF